MAPFISLFALLAFALSTVVVASPHIARNVHPHVHRAVPADAPHRALNKRCNPRPNNSTSSLPTSSTPINVAPIPSIPPSSLPGTTSPLPTSYSPTSETPTPTTYSAPSTSSTPPPPTTTTTSSSSSAPPPTTTSSSSTPPPAQTSSSSGNSCEPSFMCGTQYGYATWYDVAGAAGACGDYSNDSELVAAIDISLFDGYPNYNGANPNTNPICGQQITAYYGGKSVTVTVNDACEGCHNSTSIDFSPTAFSYLADQSVGTMPISWVWVG